MSVAEPEIVLAVDPSLRSTGYARFERRRLARCGVWSSGPHNPVLAALDTVGVLRAALADVDAAVLEVPGGASYAPHIRHGLTTYGMAVGMMVYAAIVALGGERVYVAEPAVWQRGMRTKKRRHAMARGLWPEVGWPSPTGRAKKNWNNDAGDAALLGWWFLDARHLAERCV